MSAERRRIAAIIAATAVVAGAVVAIVVVGGVTLPRFPSLAAEPDPAIPGRVAFIHEGEETCLAVVPAAGGDRRDLWCGAGLSGPLAWTDRGVAVQRFGTTSPERIVVDPDSGEVVEREPAERGLPEPGGEPGGERDDEPWRRADGARLDVAQEESGVRLERIDPDGAAHPLIEVGGVPRYHLSNPQWSPDGEWALVLDSAQRILVVNDDGGQAQVLAEEARDPAWGP